MLSRFFNIGPHDRIPFAWSSAWFATVLAAYYIVRPVREAMGSIEGSKQLPWLFTAVFITMLVAVPLYAQLVARFPRRKLVPVVYRFLALNLIAFSIAMHVLDESILKYVARVFFVWVAVYVLFSTSLFWSVQADCFSRERGKKMFGAIAGFGSLGAIAASFFVGRFAEAFGAENLLLVSAAIMEIGLFCFRKLNAATAGETVADVDTSEHSANPFAGFVQVVRSPYLRNIMFYVFSTTICGTYLYMTQADMLRAEFPDRSTRTAVFANLDFATQIITMVFQFLVASHLMRFNLKASLCVLPLVYLLGFSGLAILPALPILMVAMVLSRASTYGLAVPSLGVLYTVVTHDEKYKAKSVIDTLVIRGGDVSANWAVTAIREVSVLATLLPSIMACVAVVGIGLGALLGHRNAQVKASQFPSDEDR